MLGRRPEPGGYQQRAELVTVQRAGMRLVVHARPPEMSSRRMLEKLFGRVLVEPGDGAQPPGDGRPRPASCFQVAGEAFDVGAADREQVQGACPAPGGEKVPILTGPGRLAAYRQLSDRESNGIRPLISPVIPCRIRGMA
jgi:hypothetical protein